MKAFKKRGNDFGDEDLIDKTILHPGVSGAGIMQLPRVHLNKQVNTEKELRKKIVDELAKKYKPAESQKHNDDMQVGSTELFEQATDVGGWGWESPFDVSTEIEESSDGYSEVEIYYATNRGISSNHRIVFDNDIDKEKKLRYGKATATIPRSHKHGDVERPSFLKLEFFENKLKHLTVSHGEELEYDNFYDSISNDSGNNSVLVFVHGYNVTFNDGVLKAAQLKYDLNYTDPLILFSWPSKGAWYKYGHDKTNSEGSALEFANLIKGFESKGIKKVYIIAHSMGAICASMGLSSIEPGKLSNLKTLVMAAPDIDANLFEDMYSKKLTKLFDNFTIYTSSTDKALNASKRFNGYKRLGDVDDVLVIDNADSVDATGLDDSFLSHSYYSEEARVIIDIYHLIFNKLPPDRRNLREARNSLAKLYWKFAT